jgi:translation elongation factor EF-4
MVTDFYDQLKSRSKGYASMEYTLIDYRQNDLVKLGASLRVCFLSGACVCENEGARTCLMP